MLRCTTTGLDARPSLHPAWHGGPPQFGLGRPDPGERERGCYVHAQGATHLRITHTGKKPTRPPALASAPFSFRSPQPRGTPGTEHPHRGAAPRPRIGHRSYLSENSGGLGAAPPASSTHDKWSATGRALGRATQQHQPALRPLGWLLDPMAWSARSRDAHAFVGHGTVRGEAHAMW